MPKCVVLTLFAVLLVTSVAVAAPVTETFSIDCANGKTIGQKSGSTRRIRTTVRW